MAPLVYALLATVLLGSSQAVKRGRDQVSDAAEAWEAEQLALGIKPTSANLAAKFAACVVNIAKKVPPGELLSTIQQLKAGTVRYAVMAFSSFGSDSTNVANAELPGKLFKLLMENDAVSAVHGRVLQSVGDFVGAARSLGVPLASAAKATGVAELGQLMNGPVGAWKDENFRSQTALEISTGAEANVFAACWDGAAYTPKESELAILAFFIAVARKHWLRVWLIRFLDRWQRCRSPVLLARTGLSYLIQPLNKALGDIQERLFDVESLYQFLRKMLLHEESAHLLSQFMSCLCFFAELRGNLVCKFLRGAKQEACTESRNQTQDVHAQTGCFFAQLDALWQTFVVNPTAFALAFVISSIVIPTAPDTVATLEFRLSFANWGEATNRRSAADHRATAQSTFLAVLAAAFKALLEEFVNDQASMADDPAMQAQLAALRERLTSELNAETSKGNLEEGDGRPLTGTLFFALHHYHSDAHGGSGSALLRGLGISVGVGQGACDLVIDMLPTRREQTDQFVEHQRRFNKVHVVYTAVLDPSGNVVITKSQPFARS